MKTYESYIEILKEIYQDKRSRNSQYTLASLSRDAGYKSYHLSDVLSGRYGVSPRKAEPIADNLKMTDNQKVQFILLVTLKHAKSEKDRLIAQDKLNNLEKALPEIELHHTSLDQLNNWYDLAILNLIRSKNFKMCPIEISKRLCLSIEEVKGSLEKLRSLQFLSTESKDFNDSSYVNILKKEQTSKVVQNLHKQNLNLALQALEKYPITKRDFRNRICLLTEDQYNEINSILNAEIRKIFFNTIKTKEHTKPSNKKSHLYSFSTQLFPLEKIDPAE